ncbi:MAG: hypothetical protein ABI333_06405 [bacterium]
MRRALLTVVSSLTLVTVSGACRTPDRDARLFEPCSNTKPCEEGLVCLSTAEEGKEGQCVRLCKAGGACPQGLRCSGRYQRPAGTVETFCRRPAGEEDADCVKLASGCKPGLRCFREKCTRTCRKDSECPDRAKRCVPVVVDTVVGTGQARIFSACLPAGVKAGGKCKDTGPFCARDHHCYKETCLQGCAVDKDCGKGHVCDGSLYLGLAAAKHAKEKSKPDTQYCRKAARRNRPCHHNLNLSCERGLTCVKFHCLKVRTVSVGQACDPDRAIFCRKGGICFAGECNQACLSDEDCPRRRKEKLTCKVQVIRNKAVKLCM